MRSGHLQNQLYGLPAAARRNIISVARRGNANSPARDAQSPPINMRAQSEGLGAGHSVSEELVEYLFRADAPVSGRLTQPDTA